MIWYIALGSAVGGAGRYLLGGLMQRASATFPLGTLVINVLGSFALGLIMRYALGTPTFRPEYRGLLTIGLCGGFTTFSTFSYETVRLLQDGEWPQAAAYVAGSVVLSVAALWLGLELAERAL